MTNFLYAYPVIFDNEGRPLDGRLDFFEPGTSSPKNVFDVFGNSLGSSIETTAAGFAGEHPIFIDGNTDCKVYRGESLQYTMRLIDLSGRSSEYPAGASEVGSIDDLRELAVPEDGAVVHVVGNLVPGDMTAQSYVYSESSTAGDNGASVVKPDGATTSGRWLLVPGKLVDCRVFGIFPNTNRASAEGVSLSDFFAYCNAVGRVAWFPSLRTNGQTYYSVVPGTYSTNSMVSVDNGVTFVQSSSTGFVSITTTGGFDAGRMKFSYGTFEIVCPEFRTSWIGASSTVEYSPSERLVVDQDLAFTAEGVHVDVIVAVSSNATFEDCSIDCEGRLSVSAEYTFIGCEVTDAFFASPSDIDSDNITLSGCRLPLGRFVSSDNWAKFMMAQGENTLNFEGREVASISMHPSSTSDFVIENASVQSIVAGENVRNLAVRNCKVSGISCNITSLSVIGSEFSLTPAGNNNVRAGTLAIERSTVTGNNYVKFVAGTADVRFSTFDSKIEADKLDAFKDNFLKEVRTTTHDLDSTRAQEFSIIDCVFSSSGKHVVDTDGETGSVRLANCVWRGNHFGGVAGIEIAFDKYVYASNTYTYESNTGSVLPTTIKGIGVSNSNITIRRHLQDNSDAAFGWFSVTVPVPSTELFIVGVKSVRLTARVDVPFYENYVSIGTFTAIGGKTKSNCIHSLTAETLCVWSADFKDAQSGQLSQDRLISQRAADSCTVTVDVEVL